MFRFFPAESLGVLQPASVFFNLLAEVTDARLRSAVSRVEVNDPSANCSVWGETPWAPLPVLLMGMNASPAVPRFSSAQLPFTQWCWSVCREEQGVEVC